MNPDDEICLCFRVTRRKVLQFIRVEKPHVASQLSGCFDAGTGCGWCRPYLARLLENERSKDDNPDDLPTAAEYAKSRAAYREKLKSQTHDS